MMAFFQLCLLCATTLFVHFWVTIASVALDLQLGTAGSALGDSFQKRLQSAQETLRRPTKMEWVHIGLFGFDFAFSALTVFGTYSIFNLFALVFMPGALAAGVMCTLAKARPVMLQHLRTNTEQFANQAVRGQMKVLLIQAVLIMNSVGWYFTITVFPKCLVSTPSCKRWAARSRQRCAGQFPEPRRRNERQLYTGRKRYALPRKCAAAVQGATCVDE